MSSKSAVLLGVQQPSVRLVPLADRNDAVDAIFLAAAYGLTPDEWQEGVLEGWLGIRPDGKWAAPRCGLAVPRQNGKNGVIEIRELYGMVTLGERFLHTAHEVKALDVSEPILAERGWVTMGELTDDDRVYGPDGQLTNVVAHPIRHGRPCYELTFADGQTVVADEDHLWGVTYVSKWGRQDVRVVSTREIAENGVSSITLRSEGRDRITYNYRVQLPEPLEFPAKDYSIDPWLFGAWIGDGTSAKGELTVGAEDLAATTAQLDSLGESYRIRPDRRWPDRVFTVIITDLSKRLRTIGVLGAKSIPDEYLMGDVGQRRALLAGIADTDGSATNGQVVIGMMNQTLIEQITLLVRSLGYKASNGSVMATLNGAEVGICHRVQFRAHAPTSPFRLARKTATLREFDPSRARSSYNAIVKIKRVPTRDTRCITVDNDSRLFLVGRGFVPTHNTARKAFARLLWFFDNEKKYPELHGLVQEIRKTNGQEAIVLTNGGSVEFIARSKGSGRGFSVDVLVLDEAQELSDDAQAALLPTISASPNPQTITTGTPPGPSLNGEVFTRLRTAGLDGKDRRLCWMEWSWNGTGDLDDRTVWATVNPATGIRLSLETIADELAAMDEETFSRERLGRWSTDSHGAVLDMAAWGSLADLTSVMADPVAFAVDVAPDRSVASIGAAGYRPDTNAHVEVVDNRKGTGWVVERLVSLAEKWSPVAVVLDGAGPAGSLIAPLQEAGLTLVITSATEMGQACGGFYDAAVESRLRHLADPRLNSALGAARKRKLGDAWAWHRNNPSADLTPLVAVTLALHGLVTAPVRPTKRKRTGVVW